MAVLRPPDGQAPTDPLLRPLGACLRRARLSTGLTLGDVSERSRGRFKPSTVGGYERGERAISVDRFCALSRLYGVPPDRLLAEALGRTAPARRVVIDLERLSRLGSPEAIRVAGLVQAIRRERGESPSEVIALRSSDLDDLAVASRLEPEALIEYLSPALQP